ncbi:hypothetical protein MKC54_09830 [[Clostridium] innocuum]|nr:hypothetical protein [[Clostridium] innocuum]MCR0577186.1 hypothetical protein [[Clostridium] innocuum]
MTSYEKMQYDRAALIYDKYTVSNDITYKNNGLAQLMSLMESVFEIPWLADSFAVWAQDHPEIAELYSKVSDARDFSIMSDSNSEGVGDVTSECISPVEVSISLDPTRKPYVFLVDNKVDLCKRVALWLSDKSRVDDIDISFVGSIDALPDT